MGYYTEYLDMKNLEFPKLSALRKEQLKAISDARGGRDVFVFAADLNKPRAPISINYTDILPITDQLSNLSGEKVDLILETPGGSGEVAEHIVRILHDKYEEVAVIVPGYAKSAGTLIAMAGDEILMNGSSALGPIDAQLVWQGRQFSAHAFIEGMEKIKAEVAKVTTLNRAYIPILQAISPGDIQNAQNAMDFAKTLVQKWLVQYKFKNWTEHAKSKKPVTDQERRDVAKNIADKLGDHNLWLTHGRSITRRDLIDMGVRITNYADDPKLNEAIQRYYTLLQMTFATNIYKVFETASSQVYRFEVVAITPPSQPQKTPQAVIELKCGKCGTEQLIQANLGVSQPLQPGHLAFPKDNLLKCPKCGAQSNLSDARRQLEAQSKLPVITEG